ncbi:MAG TPA: amidase family protein, partial [Ancylobacter sp.]
MLKPALSVPAETTPAAHTRVDPPGEDVAFLGAAALGEAFRRGRLSPVEVARALVDRIEALDPAINAIVHVDRETTLAMAEAAEARYRAGAPLSALDGVPVT